MATDNGEGGTPWKRHSHDKSRLTGKTMVGPETRQATEKGKWQGLQDKEREPPSTRTMQGSVS